LAISKEVLSLDTKPIAVSVEVKKSSLVIF
jgi:hypothetical protein